MNAFERRLDDALRELRNALTGESPEGVEETLDLVRELHLPGLLAVLGTSDQTQEPRGNELLHAAAAEIAEAPAVRARALGAEEVERLLRALLIDRAPLATLAGDPAFQRQIAALAVTALSKRTGLQPGDALEIAELLLSGEFFGDVASSTAAVLHAVPGVPVALLRDVSGLPHRMLRLTAALALDLVATPFQVPAVLHDLADGKIDNPPVVLRRTVRVLYGFASLANIFETLRTLLAPGNRSFRLAVLLYARANGIPLEEDDLDVVRALFVPDSPGLGPALAAGLERLRKHSGGDGALRILQRLGRRDEP